jgi:hypothetical protein
MPRCLSQATAVSARVVASCTWKIVPTDPRTTSRWKTSVGGSLASTASAPAAHAVRTSVPRLPGRSIAAATTISGASGSASRASDVSGRSTTARTPSGRIWRATVRKAAASSSITRAPRCSARATTRASSAPRCSAGALYTSRMRVPASTAERSARDPSATSTSGAPSRASRRTAFSRWLEALAMCSRRVT